MEINETYGLENNLTDTQKSYRNFKPDSQMSFEDAVSFLNNEIKAAGEYSSIDISDKLLSEVFNRSEYDVRVPFRIDDRLEAVINSFRSDKWETLSEKEREACISDLVEEIGNRLDITKTPSIHIIEDREENLGAYSYETNDITINSLLLNYPELLVNVLAHEMRHAYQHERANMLETWDDALYKCNFDNYISPEPLPGGGWLYVTDYEDQFVEVEARVFADKFSEAMGWA